MRSYQPNVSAGLCGATALISIRKKAKPSQLRLGSIRPSNIALFHNPLSSIDFSRGNDAEEVTARCSEHLCLLRLGCRLHCIYTAPAWGHLNQNRQQPKWAPKPAHPAHTELPALASEMLPQVHTVQFCHRLQEGNSAPRVALAEEKPINIQLICKEKPFLFCDLCLNERCGGYISRS